jgi:hypothetical protein
MKAIKNLKIFREYVDRNEFEPTEQALERLGRDLIEAAGTREGYEKLAWQAGADLLLVIDDTDAFYERFGYDTVANALRASIEDGTFPLSLGFIDYDFLPPSGRLEALVRHPLIQQALHIFQTTSITLSPQNFCATPNIVKIGSQFLKYARASQLPGPTCLQMAALLLSVATNEQDAELATRTILDQLVYNEKTISVFYCWRAACERFPDLWEERTYIESLMILLKTGRTLQDQGATILSQIHTDGKLIEMALHYPRLLYIAGLSGWWLYVRYNHTKSKDIAFKFLWSIMNSQPELCKALKSYLESESQPEQTAEEIERLQKDFQKEMRILQEGLRLRIYRGLPLTLEIGSHNRINILEPLYEALEGSTALPAGIHSKIHALNATALVDDNPRQRAAKRNLQIIGTVRSDMISDYDTIIAILRRALALREKLSTASTEAVSTLPLGTPEIQREVAMILDDDPELRWVFEWFLPETVQPASPAQLVESF